jgi:hypothetical protein
VHHAGYAQVILARLCGFDQRLPAGPNPGVGVIHVHLQDPLLVEYFMRFANQKLHCLPRYQTDHGSAISKQLEGILIPCISHGAA